MYTTVCFYTKAEADAHYEYCNPPGGRPDISANRPIACKVKNPTTGEVSDGWMVQVRSWSLD